MTRREIVMATPEGPRALVVEPAQLRSLVFVVATFAGLALCTYAGSHWEELADYRHATPFNQADPISATTSRSICSRFPSCRFARSLLLLTLIPAIIGAAVVYAASGRVGITPARGLFADPQVIDASRGARRRHLPDARGRCLARNTHPSSRRRPASSTARRIPTSTRACRRCAC